MRRSSIATTISSISGRWRSRLATWSTQAGVHRGRFFAFQRQEAYYLESALVVTATQPQKVGGIGAGTECQHAPLEDIPVCSAAAQVRVNINRIQATPALANSE